MKKKRQPLLAKYSFGDGSTESLSLVESERARLGEMHRLLASDNDRLRELGETKCRQLAERLAREREFTVRAQAGSERGAHERRAKGNRTATRVLKALSSGKKPRRVSDRQVRRIIGKRPRK